MQHIGFLLRMVPYEMVSISIPLLLCNIFDVLKSSSIYTRAQGKGRFGILVAEYFLILYLPIS